jgi:hypothetical protein
MLAKNAMIAVAAVSVRWTMVYLVPEQRSTYEELRFQLD